MAKLEILLPGESSRSHDLSEEVISVGRLADNDLQIEDDSVSSHHAKLVQQGDSYLLKDLGSTNGTMVNGAAITDSLLVDGDSIRFGKVDVMFHAETSEEARPMPESLDQEKGAAASTARPKNFQNSSPFPKVQASRDMVRVGGFVLAAVGIIGFAFALYATFSGLQAPGFPAP